MALGDFPYVAGSKVRESPFADECRQLRERQLALSPEIIEAKIEAAVSYRSQIAFQFRHHGSARSAIADAGRIERFLVRDVSSNGAHSGPSWIG